MSFDPFNYPMPNRKDLMSLQTINPGKDLAKTTTKNFVTGRLESNNLNTSDIAGKLRFSNLIRCITKATRFSQSQQARVQQYKLGYCQIQSICSSHWTEQA